MKIYKFYLSGPNASGDHEDEFTEEELGLTGNETEEEAHEIIEEEFKSWRSEIDQGWFVKE